MVPKWGPPGEFTLISIPWGILILPPTSVLVSHSDLQPTPASPGDPPRSLGRSSPGSYGGTALCWVPVHSCMRPPRVFPPALWSSCSQAPLAFRAECSGGSSSQCQTLRLSWRAIFMYTCPYIACVILIFFSVRAVFSMDVCHVFPQCMLAVIPLIGGLAGAVVTRSCTGY